MKTTPHSLSPNSARHAMIRLPIFHGILAALLWTGLFGVVPAAFAAGFSEPNLVIDGRVLTLEEGAARPLFSGRLSMTLVRTDDPTHTVTRTTSLSEIGGEGGLSYRIAFPQYYLPEDDKLPGNLETGPEEIEYRIESVTVDGEPAFPQDTAQSLLSLSFGNRASLHRLNLLVSLPVEDTDGDGMPDWWEESNGLNPNAAGDALSDADGDGLDAHTEFRLGTDPNVSNTKPLVQTTALRVPSGGTAGLYLKVVDADTDPGDVRLTLDAIPSGLTITKGAASLEVGDSISHADVLSGAVRMEIARSFSRGILGLTASDDAEPAVPHVAVVVVTAYHPGERQPALWLDAEDLAAAGDPGPLVEWADASENGRDAYQADADKAPLFDLGAGDRVDFDGSAFLYLDDRNLAFENFTALVRFDVDEHGEDDQTVLRLGGMELGVGGQQNGLGPESVYAMHGGQRVVGAHLPSSEPGQFTLTRSGDQLSMGFRAFEHAPSIATAETLLSGFATLGGTRLLSSAEAGHQLRGAVREVIVFDRALEPAERTRAEEAQQSRWDGLVVWDYRDEAIALELAGSPDVANTISAGWSDDTLRGGDLQDVLRGGPGSDLLFGGGGADRFHLLASHGDDTLLDFSEGDGDVLDLTDIFGGLEGAPSDYLSFRVEVVRGEDNVPQVQSILQLDHDGDGSGVDQTVTFAGLALSDADLPRLVGQGSILLGGPVDPVSVALSAEFSLIDRTEIPRTLALTRTGNLEAALDVRVAFAGSATPGVDYAVGDATGLGSVRTVSFERGSPTATFTITPVMDSESEAEEIILSVLDDALVTSVPAEPLILQLVNAPALTLATARHATLSPLSAGKVILSRDGDLSGVLNVTLSYSGSAVNGVDYATLSTTQTFPAFVSSIELDLLPIGPIPAERLPAIALVSVVPDSTRYRIADPNLAEVDIVESPEDLAPGFQEWRDAHFPGDRRSDIVLSDADDDGNGIANGFAYLRGFDPKGNAPGEHPPLRIRIVDGHLELTTDSLAGLLGVQVLIEQSDQLGSWTAANSRFVLETTPGTDGRINRRYRSIAPLEELPPGRFFRLRMEFIE